jgi:hypothetical protein
VLFVAGTVVLVSQLVLPASAGEIANVVGFILLLAAFLCAYWLHRWEIVSDTSA